MLSTSVQGYSLLLVSCSLLVISYFKLEWSCFCFALKLSHLASKLLSERKIIKTYSCGYSFEELVRTWLANIRVLNSVGGQTPLEKENTQIAQNPAVHGFKQTGNKATFAVDSEALATVISDLAPLGVKALQSTPPTLEDLFMRYYNQQEGVADDQH